MKKNMVWVIIAVIVFLVYIAYLNKQQHPQPLTAEDRFNSLTAQEHLAEAKRALADGYKPNKDIMKTSFGRVADAEKHLGALPKDSPEWRGEGKNLAKEIEVRKADLKVVAGLVIKKYGMKQRKDFADKWESALLDNGIDAHISTSGQYQAVLNFKYALMGRPLVHKLINDGATMNNLRAIGFEKIIFSDGYYNTWTFDLKARGG